MYLCEAIMSPAMRSSVSFQDEPTLGDHGHNILLTTGITKLKKTAKKIMANLAIFDLGLE